MTVEVILLILRVMTFIAIATLIVMTLRHSKRIPQRKRPHENKAGDLHVSLADRIAVWRTNATGRPAPNVRLASYAILRAESMLLRHEELDADGSAAYPFQRLFTLVSITIALIAGQLLVTFLIFHLRSVLIVAIILFFIAALNAVAVMTARPLFLRDRTMARAAIAANRRLLNES